MKTNKILKYEQSNFERIYFTSKTEKNRICQICVAVHQASHKQPDFV